MDNIETIKRVVEVGLGLSMVPELSVVQETRSETLKAIQFSDEVIIRPLGIISKRSRRFTPAVQEFVNFLRGESRLGATQGSNQAFQAAL